MEKNDFTILKQYHNRWVAIEQNEENKVVGVGDTLKEALDQAAEKGVKEPIVTRVPSDYGTYIL
jgi:hypothetical protein